MKAIIRKSLPAAVAATLTAGVVAIPAIAATDDTADDSATSTEQAEDAERHGFGFRPGRHLEEGELAERLADELGLDTDTVQDALDAVRGDIAGERLAEQVEAGRLTQDQADRIAAAIADGDTDAAREVFDEVRLEHLTEKLAEKVEAGELTQEQADEILARAEEGDFPRHRGRRGHGPRGEQDTAAPEAEGASI